MLSDKIQPSIRQSTNNDRGPEPALRDNLAGKIPQKDTAFPPQKLSYLLYYAFKTELRYKWVRVNLKSTVFLKGNCALSQQHLCFMEWATGTSQITHRHTHVDVRSSSELQYNPLKTVKASIQLCLFLL